MSKQDKTKNIHQSDSAMQRGMEKIIIDALKINKLTEIEQIEESDLSFVKINNPEFKYIINGCKLEKTTGKSSYQLDIFDEEQGVIGEIFTSLSNKPGQQRKIKTDILKLITIEKAFINSGEKNLKKILIFTINHDELNKHGITQTNKFISLEALKKSNYKDKISGTWLYQTIELFNIHIYYYILDKSEIEMYNDAVGKQKQGNH